MKGGAGFLNAAELVDAAAT
ncbi:MAG: hypothetical protein MZW92_52245 [Comamonadaceae bacterium]|nr:hypothetical protein [Comamonadaceae bacterium]